MSSNDSKQIQSSQNEPSSKIESLLSRRAGNTYQKPIADHTRRSTEVLWPLLEMYGTNIILDSGCGTGESTLHLAKKYPECLIVGIDKSNHRLAKHHALSGEKKNYQLVHGDLIDFILLCIEHDIVFQKHYMLYPNPWPKSEHLARRWHAHAIFPKLITRSLEIELRTNWKIYALEHHETATQLHMHSTIEESFSPSVAISAFERKYVKSGHSLFRVLSQRA